MKIRFLFLVILAAALLATGFLTRVRQNEPVSKTEIESNMETAEKGHLAANYGSVPLHFEANAGQADAQVKFLSRGSGYSLFLTSDEAVLALQKPTGDGGQKTGDILRMKFADANSSQEIAGENLLEGKTNYGAVLDN